MIINKSTSNPLLVGTLVLKKITGSYVEGATEFDTETMEATVSGQPVACSKYWFAATSADHEAEIAAVIPEVDFEQEADDGSGLETIQIKDPAVYHIASAVRIRAKRAMDDTDTRPANAHESLGLLSPCLAQCSNCSTKFVVFVSRSFDVYKTIRASAADQYLTAVQLDPLDYVCDNCGEHVTFVYR